MKVLDGRNTVPLLRGSRLMPIAWVALCCSGMFIPGILSMSMSHAVEVVCAVLWPVLAIAGTIGGGYVRKKADTRIVQHLGACALYLGIVSLILYLGSLLSG